MWPDSQWSGLTHTHSESGQVHNESGQVHSENGLIHTHIESGLTRTHSENGLIHSEHDLLPVKVKGKMWTGYIQSKVKVILSLVTWSAFSAWRPVYSLHNKVRGCTGVTLSVSPPGQALCRK